MKNTTVTIWVNNITEFLTLIQIIEKLPLEIFEYSFNTNKVRYSDYQVSLWNQINIPATLYLKWKIIYDFNLRRVKED